MEVLKLLPTIILNESSVFVCPPPVENHLASNIQKSRLVQYDLQVAKRMQDEEDKRAWTRNQRRQRDRVHSDNEIAQEIQEQQVKQALDKRQQEEKDEAIARRLHEKELKEERKRKKQLQDVPYEDGYYEDNRGRKHQGEYGVQEVIQGVTRLDLRGSELTDLEVAMRLQEEELKEIARLLMEKEKRVHIRSMEMRRQEPEWKPEPGEAVRPRSREGYELQRPRNDKPTRPPRPTGDYENIDAGYGNTGSPCSPRPSSRSDAAYKGRKHQGEYGVQEVIQGVTRLDLRGSELTDLEVAMRLQEEELKEIARLLMEKEKRVHIRSMEMRRQEPEWKPEPGEAVRPRSREGYELQRPRNDKPTRPPRPTGDYENIDAGYGNTGSPCSPRPSSRSDAAYKGSDLGSVLTLLRKLWKKKPDVVS
ncbi:UNVERIFIED_CONTAM: hypothetical protein FKN15_009320 [Acipenser sinensis]